MNTINARLKRCTSGWSRPVSCCIPAGVCCSPYLVLEQLRYDHTTGCRFGRLSWCGIAHSVPLDLCGEACRWSAVLWYDSRTTEVDGIIRAGEGGGVPVHKRGLRIK